MTPAETPRCADISFAYSDDKEIVALYLTIDGKTKLFVERGNEGPRIEALYARIRELVAQVQDGLDTWPAFGITNGQRQWRLQAKAALARSEGGGA